MTVFLGQAADWLDVSGCPVPAEYAFVVPGEENTRPLVAAILYRRGIVKKILVAENVAGSSQTAGLLRTTSQLIVEILRRRGVRDADIIPIGGATANSWDDLAILSDFLRRHPSSTVSLVTSSFHTRRCRWILRQQLGGEAKRVTFVAAPLEWYDGIPWWTRREVAATVASEYLKLGFYWVRYGYGSMWIAFFVGIVFGGFVVLRFARRSSRVSVDVRSGEPDGSSP
ncbi:MAG: YdcF family protein [Thermoguttaceae bacterium]|nr:YdcF family protein [Thermoguttaceae bacterium]MDW8078903.1 ElyC/SanA/YdcF family protein [Thermoguttaceae bacterium]